MENPAGDHQCRRFEKKVIIITGGGGAIGYAAAERLASEGATIVLTDIIAEEKLEEKAKVLADTNGTLAHGYQGDVTKVEDVKRVIANTVALYGRVDCLFNNAGY